MTGSIRYTVKDNISSAIGTTLVKTDVNFDHISDTNDYLRSYSSANPNNRTYNVGLLMSGVSFSCGNLLPALLKDSNVTLLGQTSGGGACSVATSSTADGDTFNYSSRYQICTYKNGAVYDVDQGADPDIYIGDFKKFYDRSYIASVMDNI